MSARTPWHWLPLEGRAAAEFALAGWHARRLRDLPAGDGHAVLVIPGFGGDDHATAPLRRALKQCGYAVHGWGQGRNTGMRRAVGQALGAQLARLREHSGGRVSLIGWSLGGIFAREMARREADAVRQVITLGSPIQDSDHTTIDALFRLLNPGTPARTPPEQRAARSRPPAVPCTAIYTRSDGIVPWRAALEPAAPHTRNVRVRGSHMGLPANPQVWRACAEALATPLPRPGGAKTGTG